MTQVAGILSADVILELIIARLAALQSIARETIDVRERFSRYGLDSQGATSLISDLADAIQRPLSPVLIWEYPTPEALARHLAGGAEKAPPQSQQNTFPLDDEPIAIIGLSCRLPKAPSPAAFWHLLCDGTDAITEVPRQRWDARALFDRDLLAPGKSNSRWGGFIDQVDSFDPLFFGISPREAIQMDPQQRLMLELSWEALEDANLLAAELKDSRTGVFFGVTWTDYAHLLHRSGLGGLTQHTVTGYHHSIIANRVSYVLGLQGPSLTIDTACSSSLVAVHLACESLRRGESTTALAGGVNLTLIPQSMVGLAKWGALSPHGRCFAFDARADGYVRGEGGGVVVLKPLSRALADGDPIYCLIRGSAVNNDGASNGLTAPNPAAQEAVLRAAYARAGIDPASVDYVEAHGTGTQLGDPIEAKVLGTVLGSGRPPERPLLLGSVKTNIGHLEPAAGIAGLIKVALAIKHGQIPPSLHFETPNAHIPFAELHLQVQTRLGAWPSGSALATAGVSAFGFGGTNCHVVLQAVSPPPAEQRPGRSVPALAPGRLAKPVFVFSGQGSQWVGMGVRLMQKEPVFRALLVRCDALIREHLGWSLLTELTLPKERSRMDQIDVTFPAIAAVQIALAALLRSWGVEPALVIGHSSGEVAAAQVAGVLSLEEAMRVICTQGRLFRRIRGRGTMGIVALSWQEAGEALSGYAGHLWRAIHESPASTVISGEPESLAALFAVLERQKVFCRRINVDVAAHSAQVDSIRAELCEALRGITPCRADVPVISSVTGTFLDGERFTAEHWVKNIAESVLFAESMRTAASTHHALFLEVSPHPLLPRALKSCLRHAGREGVILSSLRRDEDERAVLLDMVGTLPAAQVPLPSDGGAESAGPAYVLPLSAHRPEALAVLADAHSALLENADDSVRIGDLAFSMSVRRNHHNHRLAAIASTQGEFRDALAAFRAGREHEALVQGQAALGAQPKLVFVFPGHGSQWLGMGSELLREEPAFRRAMEVCAQAIHHEARFSILDAIREGNSGAPLGAIDRVQPVLFAMEVALAALWRDWGIQPDVVVGHSMGEVAAAHVSGALSLADAAQIICRRSRLLRRVSGQGAMALVECTLQEAERELQDYREQLSVAVSNGPRSTVIAGDPGALEQLLKRCAEQKRFFRYIKIDVASHSPQVDPLLGELHAALQGIQPLAPRLPMFSTVTGKAVLPGALDAAYWVQNLRAPVLFAQTIEPLIRSDHLLFLEISPHPLLLPAISEALHAGGRDGLTLPSLRRQDAERPRMLKSLGALYTRGYEIEWSRLHPRGGRRLALPSYPWQRERLWIDAEQDAAASPSASAEPLGPAASKLAAPDLFAEWLYSIQWKRTHLDLEVPLQPRTGVWLLFLDRSSVGTELASQLQARGQRCVRFFVGTRNQRSGPDTYEVVPQDARALQAALSEACGEVPPQGVVHLWSLDLPTTPELTPASLESAQRLGSLSALHLAQAMLAMGWRQVPPLALVTRGAQTVGSARTERAALQAIAQTPLWGLGRTLAVEHPELRCRCIDLDPDGGTEVVLPLIRELALRDGAADVALRTDGRYVGRLSRWSLASREERVPAQSPAPSVHGDCAYLIFGGTNGHGLWAAEWLVTHGARHLVLIDRADVVADQARLARIRETGADVVVTQAEAPGGEEIRSVLRELDERSLPLRGVIYAETPPDRETPVLALRSEQLRGALAPALRCAWSLHTETLAYPLEFFVLFASSAAVLGVPGQASSAAVSSFLSALAAQRRADGRGGLCILWGSMEEREPAAASRADAAPEAYRGIEALHPGEGMKAMQRLLGEELSAVAVMKLNVRHFVEFYPAAAGSSLLGELRQVEEPTRRGRVDAPRWRALLINSRPEERAALLEKLIGAQLGQTLRQDSALIPHQAPFRALGLDSGMAIELRNRLESHLELKLSAALLFTYANVSALAAYILTALGLSEMPAAPAAAPSRLEDSGAALDMEVNQMSETEAEAALLARLQELR